MPHPIARILLLTALLVAVLSARATPPSQLHPQGFVNDFAHVLSPADVEALEQRAAELQSQRGVQVAMVTVDSVGSDDIANYAYELAQGWGVGQKGQDNGLLILLAVRDHKDSSQVGYGLEPYITDADVGTWMRGLRPQLQAGQYGVFFNSMLSTVESTLQARMGGAGKIGTAPRRTQSDNSGAGAAGLILFILIFIGLGLASRRGGSGPMGCLFPLLMMGGFGGPGYRGGGGFGGGMGGGGFGGFGGGGFGGGGASGSW